MVFLARIDWHLTCITNRWHRRLGTTTGTLTGCWLRSKKAIGSRAMRSGIRRARGAGIGQITFLNRFTKSDDERRKVLSGILAREAAQRR
jgi:hypothetical protein